MTDQIIDELQEEINEENNSSNSIILRVVKYIFIIIIITILISFFTKKFSKEDNSDNESANNLFTQEYLVKKDITLDENLYWLVVSNEIINVLNSVWWILSYSNCQPWKNVFAWEMLYHITSSDDINTQNSKIQLKYISKQIDNLESIISSTQKSFDIQSSLLQDQKEINDQNYALFKQNLDNLKKQRNLNSDDIEISLDNLDEQLDLLKKSQDTDKYKLDSSLNNFRLQSQNTVKDAMRSLDMIFGITDPSSNSNIESSLSASNINLKNRIKSDFNGLYNDIDDILDMNENDLIDYFQDLWELFQNAAEAVDASIPSESFPMSSASWPSIQTYYSIFSSYSNAMFSLKSNFESLSFAYDTTKNNYNTQINVMENNIDTTEDNKMQSADLSFDSNINSMQTQLNSLQLSTQSLDKQIQNISNTENIQLAQLKSQYMTLQQNYEVLANSIWGEVIRSSIDWIVKTSNVSINNKLAPNTLLCQIVPRESTSTKIQIYSSQKLEIWTKVKIFDWNNEIGQGAIDFQLPYVDNTTQNYIYEITSSNLNIIEWKRLRISLSGQESYSWNIMIPLDYVQPKLDGHYVYIKVKNDKWQSAAFNKKIQVWEIDNGYIQVLSGLKIGNILLK